MRTPPEKNITPLENHSQVGGARKISTSKKRKPHPYLKGRRPYPSDKSQWAYMMQGIEPTDEAINQAFPGYHPQWVQQSQAMPVTANGFKSLRTDYLRLNQKQCAAYLRVSVKTISQWENGTLPVPFMAVELLRLVLNSNSFRMSHPMWDGWFISPHDGRFVSPDCGKLDFSPHELSYIRDIYRQKAIAEADKAKLTADVAQLQTENAELRAMLAQGEMLNELQTVKNQLEAMLDKFGTAKVYQFPSNQPDQTRKVATA